METTPPVVEGVTEQWINHVVGRNWEIYWANNDSSSSSSSESEPQRHQQGCDEQDEQNGEECETDNHRDNAVHDDCSVVIQPSQPKNGRRRGEENSPTKKRRKLNDTNKDNRTQVTRQSTTVQKRNLEDDKDDDDDDENDNDDDEEDWYAGYIHKFLGYQRRKNMGSNGKQLERQDQQQPLFQVHFVGDEEQLYEMCLRPDALRPCARTWIQRSVALLSLGGGDGGSTGTSQTIQQHQSKNKSKNNNQKPNNRLFSLKTPLDQQLPMDTRRLEDEDDLLHIKQSLDNELQPVQRLPAIKTTTTTTTTTTLGRKKGKAASAAAAVGNLPEWNELVRIREMMVLIRQQIHLRSWLSDPEQDEPISRSSEEEKDYPPSEACISFLIDQLEAAERCCRWYDQCYVLLLRVLQNTTATTTKKKTKKKKTGEEDEEAGDDDDETKGGSQQQQQQQLRLVTKDEILSLFAENGRKTLLDLVSLDPSLDAFQRKRRRKNNSNNSIMSPVVQPTATTASSPCVTPRRTKRRRPGNNSNGTTVAGTELLLYNEDEVTGEKVLTAQVEDFYFAATIQQLVERLAKSDQRWFSLAIGRMLCALSIHVIIPILNWEQKCLYYLGETNVLKLQSSCPNGNNNNNKGSNNNDDDDSDSSNNEHLDDRNRRMINITDIEALLDEARNDAVICKLDWSSSTASLEKKLQDVANFEKQCWEAMKMVFNEVEKGTTPHNCPHDDDEILTKLKVLKDIMERKESAVWNVDPFGRNTRSGTHEDDEEEVDDGKPPILTREMLVRAVENRQWFLDLQHAESHRERTRFVQDVVSSRRRRSNVVVPNKLMAKKGKRRTVHNNNHNNTKKGNNINQEEAVYTIEKRIEELSTLLNNDNTALFDQLIKTLNDMGGGGDIRKMKPTLASMLEELQKVRIVSAVEEMIVTRMDIASWLEDAERILDKPMIPSFDEISEIKARLDQILMGQSPTRTNLTSSLRPCATTDNEIRQFARRDLDTFCEPVRNKVIELYQKSFAWKERCDHLLAALQGHGNSSACNYTGGAGCAGGPVKSAAMVDIKRIEDLLQDYPSLETSIVAPLESLRLVHEECVQWSDHITDLLFKNDVPFADILSAVETANQVEGRPKGIIVYPTRQSLESVIDFLRWHGAVKALVEGHQFRGMETAYQLLMEGIEVVELYGNTRTGGGGGTAAADDQQQHYVLRPEPMRELLRQKLDSRKPMRSFSRSKLESHSITEHLLGEMVNECRDRKEGFPLFSLLLLAWRVEAEHFAERALSSNDNDPAPTVDRSYETAYALKAAMPCVKRVGVVATREGEEEVVDFLSATISQSLSDFYRLLAEAEQANDSINEAIMTSKVILRDCLQQNGGCEGVRSHATTLKDHLLSIRRDAGVNPRRKTTILSLPRFIEGKLDREIKLFTWLSKALQYPDVFRDADEEEETTSNAPSSLERMPFDVLVKLHENKPDFTSGMGDFSLILVKLTELFEASNKWQDEVSNETLLSLRGGKRRTTISGGENEMDDGPQHKIDLARVLELSESPILKKIAMPREEAVHSMVQNTRKFEVLLQDFIGKDYSGKYPDRIQLPSNSSLIDDDGRFILLRLTGSPLFLELKSSIRNIGSVADDVLADTPGKATFDWICKSVAWIEELSSYIDRDKIGYSQLSVEKTAVLKLLTMADAILLDVPDDLRRTLSKYGILVSTNKDGRLTVKSKKGAAHHSIGTTAIRWSPVLIEALKEDVGKTTAWETKLKDFSDQYKEFNASLSSSSSIETQDVIRAQFMADEMTQLLWEASELVVVPDNERVAEGVEHQQELALFIQSHSTPEVDEAYASQELNTDANIARDRGLLLDSLLDRAVVVGGVPDAVIEAENVNDPLFRVAARNLISRGLEQGITAIASDLDDCGDSIGLCKVRAGEIEEALFRLLHPKDVEDTASGKYREKVRCLKRAFCDLCNRTMCLQVICGEIEPEKLVRMSSEQLASPQIRRDREAIEARAKEKTILTRSLAKKEKKDESGDEEHKEMNGEIMASEKKCVKSMKTEPILDGESNKRTEKVSNGHDENHRIAEEKRPAAGNTIASPTRLVRSSSRPPAPPSLADSLRSQHPVSNGIGNVLNSSGSDQFTLSVSNTMFTFSFVPKTVLKPFVPAHLPQNLRDHGRTKVQEFIDFLSEKRHSDHWDIYVLRLVPCSEIDTEGYRKFYKDFEGKQRIAMCKLPNKNKLFLITPKFHKDVKSLIPLENASSTYGVLLWRNCD